MDNHDLRKELDDSIKKIQEDDNSIVLPPSLPKEPIKVEPTTPSQVRLRTKLKNNYLLYFLFAVSVVLVFVAGFQYGSLIKKPEPVLQEQKAELTQQEINDIAFVVTNAFEDEDNIYLDVEVKNNGENNFYMTVHTIELIVGEERLLPDVKQSELPLSFYGEKVLPDTTVSAGLTFPKTENTGDTEEYTLIIKNVSDVKHFIWDYLITVPAPELVETE